jgi:hypothetical protein
MSEPATIPGTDSRGPSLAYGVTWPSLGTFTDLARTRRVIPVVRRLLADAETPVGVYRKLAKNAPGTFLLESAEHGGVWSRYSIVQTVRNGPHITSGANFRPRVAGQGNKSRLIDFLRNHGMRCGARLRVRRDATDQQ